MDIDSQDLELVDIASELVRPEQAPGGMVSEVGCALKTKDGNIYKGVCMHLVCGLGFCAEHTAIATAITNQGLFEIDTIVAVNSFGVIPPCGRCRELINDISPSGSEAMIIVSETEKVELSELLPRPWNPKDSLT